MFRIMIMENNDQTKDESEERFEVSKDCKNVKEYRREYDRLSMRKYRALESDDKRKFRSEAEKQRFRNRMSMMSPSEKAEFREKRRIYQAIRRSDVPDDKYLQHLKNESFKYKLKIMSASADELIKKRNRDKSYSANYRKDLGPGFQRGHFTIYQRDRKKMLRKRKMEKIKTLCNYSKYIRSTGIRYNVRFIDGSWKLKDDKGYEPFLSYLAGNCFVGRIIGDELKDVTWLCKRGSYGWRKMYGRLIGYKYVVSPEYNTFIFGWNSCKDGSSASLYFKEKNRIKDPRGLNLQKAVDNEEIKLIRRLEKARDMGYVCPTLYYLEDRINGIEPFLRYLEYKNFDLYS